jgi:hypothetical protein
MIVAIEVNDPFSKEALDRVVQDHLTSGTLSEP